MLTPDDLVLPRQHVYPLSDSREHNLNGVECWCNPRYSRVVKDESLPGSAGLLRPLSVGLIVTHIPALPGDGDEVGSIAGQSAS